MDDGELPGAERRVWAAMPAGTRTALTGLSSADRTVRERLADTVRPALDGGAVPLVDEPERSRGRGYYTGCALRITVLGGSLEIGDGGLTDWTARLSGDAKERCLVSCLATERLVDSISR